MKEKETYSVMKIKDEKGNTKEVEVLYLFTPKNQQTEYVIYTDHSTDESGSIRVYAHKYNKTANQKKLMPIETEEEWYTIEAILSKLEEKSKEE